MSSAVSARLVATAADQSGIKNVTPVTALYQDPWISGDDVTELVASSADRSGPGVRSWPRQRFAELSEPHPFTGIWFFWRLLTWAIRGYIFDDSPFEQLETRHIAACVEAGHWIEP